MIQEKSEIVEKLENKNEELRLDNLRLMSLINSLVEALQWCGGSPDFALEGEARHGWEKGVLPLLERAAEEIEVIKERKEYWDIQ